MNKKRSTECPVCKKFYSTFSNLAKHVTKYHPSKLNKIETIYKNSNNFKYTCECGKNFNHLRHFKAHQKVHSDQIDNKSKGKKCPLCDYYKYKKSDILNHFKDVHNIDIEYKEFVFLNVEQFYEWKTNVENENLSSYLQNSKSTKSNTVYYICHRSGSYISKGKGKRRLKINGTNKINAYCPAGIKLTKVNGSYKALLIKTHIGHTADIQHLQLTSSERKDIAVKIANGVEFDDILYDIKHSVIPDVPKRIHLLTKKDLRNIENSLTHPSAMNVKDIKVLQLKKAPETDVEGSDSILDAQTKDLTKRLEEEKEKVLLIFSNYLKCITSIENLEILKKLVTSLCNSSEYKQLSKQ